MENQDNQVEHRTMSVLHRRHLLAEPRGSRAGGNGGGLYLLMKDSLPGLLSACEPIQRTA
jgi:hypothetical protein